MTTVIITRYRIGLSAHGDRPTYTEVKRFSYRFQARSWLLLNGFLHESANVFQHVGGMDSAAIESRRALK